MPGSLLPTDDEQAVGRLLLLIGLAIVAIGVAMSAYTVLSDGFDAGDPLGGRFGTDVAAVTVGVFAVAGGSLLASVGAMIAKSVRRPRSHRSYGGAYLDDDD